MNALERQSVILELTGSAAFGKQNLQQNIILSNSTSHNLAVNISVVCFFLKTARARIFFFRGHPRRFEVVVMLEVVVTTEKDEEGFRATSLKRKMVKF